MSRQVDVKALVSHIVRGDGADKCRICMGDTSEGQVYLGDTVMMDEDKPVTLSEIVESITGVEVPLARDLPPVLCSVCSASALAAGAFRSLCHQSSDRWNTMVSLLQSLPTSKDTFPLSTAICVVLNENEITILDHSDPVIRKTEVRSKEYECKSRKEEKNDSKSKPVFRIKESQGMNRNKVSKRTLDSFTWKTGAEQKLKVARHQCPDCNKSFACPRDFYEHFVDSTDLKRACMICAAIMSQSELISHLKMEHMRDVYCCKKCKTLFLSLKRYKTHLQKSHMSGAHHCGECGRRFGTNQALSGHTSMHVVKHCPSCNELFRNHRCYVHHVQNCCNLDCTRDDTYRTKTKVLFEVKNRANRKVKVGARGSTDVECICDYCNKKFAGKKYLCAHIQIVHLKNTHRPCPYCGKSLAAAHMSQHVKSHEKNESFVCKQCGQTLKTKVGFIQHLRLHTGEKPYRCHLCDETFSASSRRSEHIRKVHTKKDQLVLNYACEMCPARFRLPCSLRNHVHRVHAKEGHGQTIECPDCLVKFSSSRGMIYHRRTHQRDK